MNDFPPLFESSPSSTTRELLRAGRRDVPPPDARLRVAAALGVTAGAMAATLPAAASLNSAAAASGTAGATSTMSAASALTLGKWLLTGIAAGTLVSGAVAVVQRVEPAGPRGSARAAPVSIHSSTPRASRVARASEPAVTAADISVVPPATTSPKSFPAESPSADAALSSALRTEAARIDAARQSLGHGDVRRALIELDWYERSKVVGVLDREAELLRIRALVQAGQGARAVEVARSYLAAHPHDAYAPQLEKFIASRGLTFPSAGGSIDGATDITGQTP